MEIRVLGPLTVVGDDGAEVVLKGTRLRSLLALLTLHVGEVVAADRVAEELWGDAVPADASAALQTQVSRLRAALRAGGVEDCVVTRKPGYVLDVDPVCVDAHRFEARARDGRRLLDAHDADAATAVLTEALTLWSGDVLADLPDDGLAQAERARLRELHRLVAEDRIDAALAAGRHQELVAEAERLVAAEPLRERRTAQLMLALYRCGRQADALRAYQATRRLLADELGIEPGAELRQLEAAVLAQDPQLDAPTPQRTDAPAPSTRAPRLSVATPLSPLVGRTAELANVEALAARHRLLTLVGPGGAGKTRLAVEAAQRLAGRFDDGAAMVELAPVEDEGAVVGAVARALGAEEPRASGSAHDDLAQLLGDRHLLLLLDNCEHLLDEVARVAATLLGRCPRLTVLATSRQALGLTGEASFLVPPLDRTSAVELFTQRAGASSAGFRVDEDDREFVDEVCARLDDMPLAIELAASRLRVFSPEQLAARLDDRFRVVTGGSRVALPRHQTLRAVVDWSYDLLDGAERRVFERLSVFAGGCTLDAAEWVCADDDVDAADVADILDRLVDKSLVVVSPADDGYRFGMLQTLAEYARERLAHHDGGAVRRRLAEWLLRQAIEGEATGDERHLSFALRFGRELDNVRVGLAWAMEHDPALGVEIAARLVWFWFFNDAQVDGFRALSQGLAKAPELDDEVRAKALTWGSLLAGTVGEVELGERWGDAAVEHARRTGDPKVVGRTACLRAERLVDQGRLGEAEALFAESRRSLEQVGDAFGLAYLDLREGVADTYNGNAARAYWRSQRALRTFRRIGDAGLLILSLQRVGESADVCGYLDEASAALEEAIARNDGLPGIGRRSQLVSRLVRVRINQGRLDEALALAEESVALARRQTWGMVTGMALQARGRALGALGRLDEAVDDLQQAVELFGAVGVPAMAESVRAELDDLQAVARG